MASLIIGSRLLEYLPLIFYKNKVQFPIAESHFPYTKKSDNYLLRCFFFIQLQYMSLLKIRSITVPTLFVSGLADTLVPPQMMMDLHNRCKSSWKRMLPISGGTHNETWNQPGYYQNISLFITELRDNPQPQTFSDWQIHEI